MKRTIIKTQDGSTTIKIDDWDECYHSKHGAIEEAKHVFVKNGLNLFDKPISILEIGFGTGLNAFITFLEAEKRNQIIEYTAVEAYPISIKESLLMNFVSELAAENSKNIFETLHTSHWDKPIELSKYFAFCKRKDFFENINDVQKFDLIYFDAFGYRVQPELWSSEIFKKMYIALKTNGVLVTYAARGIIKRNMTENGFFVEKLKGAPGKREMFRARK